MKTNEEKSQVIGKRLGIHYRQVKTPFGHHTHAICTCGKPLPIDDIEKIKGMCIARLPDFFTPDGQVVLAGALLDTNTGIDFCFWYDKEYKQKVQVWLNVVAKTKLAELFFEFIESEGKNE